MIRVATLQDVVRSLPFDEYCPHSLVNSRGYYEMPLDPDFPLAVKLFRYHRQQFPLHCHERLELAALVEGEGYFRVGRRRWHCSAGDLVVVDSLKPHTFEDFRGEHNRAVIVTFLPRLVLAPGSSPEDYVFLVPFYCQGENVSPVVHAADDASAQVHRALAYIVEMSFNREPYYKQGCKVALLEALLDLAKHFRAAQGAASEPLRQRAARLAKLMEYLHQHFHEQVTVDDAASVAAMSRSCFSRFFKRNTGESFVSYLTEMRLNQAIRLLRESDIPVAEVGAAAGFADQSYFDRRFKQHFGECPRTYRLKSRTL